MEFVGEPIRVSMPYDVALELALTRIFLIQAGVPARVADSLMPTVAG